MTKDGTDPLLSKEENISDLLEPPTEIQKNHAITNNIGGLLVVVRLPICCLKETRPLTHTQMKAVNKFKSLLYKNHPERERTGDLSDKQLFQPPAQMHESDFEAKHVPQRSKSTREDHFATMTSTRSIPDLELPDAVTSEPVQQAPETASSNRTDTADSHDTNTTAATNDSNKSRTSPQPPTPTSTSASTTSPLPIPSPGSGKGHAQDPLHEAPLYLRVGSGHADHPDSDSDSIAQSPAAAEFDIYDHAYRQEVARIRGRSEEALVYLTRRVGAQTPPHGRVGRAGTTGDDRKAGGEGVTSNPSNPAGGSEGLSNTSNPHAVGNGATEDQKSATAVPAANQGREETHEA